MHVAKATLVVATIIIAAVLRAAPHAAAIPPEHPHIEGRQAVVLEVEGAPSAKATHAGESLPDAGQSRLPGGGDLQSSLGGPTAATVSLKPKAIKP